jgi:hypothetical protein
MRSLNGLGAAAWVTLFTSGALFFDRNSSFNPLLSAMPGADTEFGARNRALGTALVLPEGSALLGGMMLGGELLGGVKNGSSGGVAPGASLAAGNSFGLMFGDSLAGVGSLADSCGVSSITEPVLGALLFVVGVLRMSVSLLGLGKSTAGTGISSPGVAGFTISG